MSNESVTDTLMALSKERDSLKAGVVHPKFLYGTFKVLCDLVPA